MIEIMENLNTFVNAKTGNPTRNINEDFFSRDNKTEVMCRHDASPLIVKRYMTGSYIAGFNFSYYVKCEDPISARQTLQAIEDALNIDNFSEAFGLKDGQIIILTRPTPVSRDENGTVIYTSSYQLVYFQEV